MSEKDFNKWCSIIKAAVQSFDSPPTMWKLNQSVGASEHEDIPYKRFNFSSLKDMLDSIPGLKIFHRRGRVLVRISAIDDVPKSAKKKRVLSSRLSTLRQSFGRVSTYDKRPNNKRLSQFKYNTTPNKRNSSNNSFRSSIGKLKRRTTSAIPSNSSILTPPLSPNLPPDITQPNMSEPSAGLSPSKNSNCDSTTLETLNTVEGSSSLEPPKRLESITQCDTTKHTQIKPCSITSTEAPSLDVSSTKMFASDLIISEPAETKLENCLALRTPQSFAISAVQELSTDENDTKSSIYNPSVAKSDLILSNSTERELDHVVTLLTPQSFEVNTIEKTPTIENDASHSIDTESVSNLNLIFSDSTEGELDNFLTLRTPQSFEVPAVQDPPAIENDTKNLICDTDIEKSNLIITKSAKTELDNIVSLRIPQSFGVDAVQEPLTIENNRKNSIYTTSVKDDLIISNSTEREFDNFMDTKSSQSVVIQSVQEVPEIKNQTANSVYNTSVANSNLIISSSEKTELDNFVDWKIPKSFGFDVFQKTGTIENNTKNSIYSTTVAKDDLIISNSTDKEIDNLLALKSPEMFKLNTSTTEVFPINKKDMRHSAYDKSVANDDLIISNSSKGELDNFVDWKIPKSFGVDTVQEKRTIENNARNSIYTTKIAKDDIIVSNSTETEFDNLLAFKSPQCIEIDTTEKLSTNKIDTSHFTNATNDDLTVSKSAKRELDNFVDWKIPQSFGVDAVQESSSIINDTRNSLYTTTIANDDLIISNSDERELDSFLSLKFPQSFEIDEESPRIDNDSRNSAYTTSVANDDFLSFRCNTDNAIEQSSMFKNFRMSSELQTGMMGGSLKKKNFKEWCSIIGAKVLLFQPLTVSELNRNVKLLEGEEIPFEQFNFRKLEDMVRAIPGLEIVEQDGKDVVQVIPITAQNSEEFRSSWIKFDVNENYAKDTDARESPCNFSLAEFGVPNSRSNSESHKRSTSRLQYDTSALMLPVSSITSTQVSLHMSESSIDSSPTKESACNSTTETRSNLIRRLSDRFSTSRLFAGENTTLGRFDSTMTQNVFTTNVVTFPVSLFFFFLSLLLLLILSYNCYYLIILDIIILALLL